MKTTQSSLQAMIKTTAIMTLFFAFILQTKAFAAGSNTSVPDNSAGTVKTVNASQPATDSLALQPRGCAGTAQVVPYVLGCTVYFSGISTITSGTGCQYTIDFGDGSSETSTNPWFTHNYSQSGTYTVTYVIQICAADGSTCSDDVTISVYVPCYD